MLSKFKVATTLPTKNLKAAQDFYSKRVGLKRTAGSAKDGFLQFTAGRGSEILLFESDSEKSDDTAATFEVDDLDKEMAALRKRGVEFEEYDLPEVKTHDGVAVMGSHRMAWFKDPGGNVVALHEGESNGRRRNGGK